MASTTFIDGQTVIQADWLNDVNAFVYAGGGTQYVLPTASTTVLGGIRVDGSTIVINNQGIISAPGSGGGGGGTGDLELRLANKTAADQGTGLVGHNATLDYAAGTVGKHLKAIPCVTDAPWNAQPAPADCTAALQAAYNATPAGGVLQIPAGLWNYGTITGTKKIRWLTSGAYQAAFPALPLINLPGVIEGWVDGGTYLSDTKASPISNTNKWVRNIQEPGPYSIVNSLLRLDTTVGANTNSFEWGLCTVMNNYAAGGENLAFYTQGNKYGTGPNWSMCAEYSDKTRLANPDTYQAIAEMNMSANGTDNNNARRGIDVIAYKLEGGADMEAYAGIRVCGGSDAKWKNGILFKDFNNCAVRIESSGIFGIQDLGSKTVGIQLEGTYSSAALRIKQNNVIAFEQTNSRTLQWFSLGAWVFGVAGTSPHILYDNGDYETRGRWRFSTATGRNVSLSASNGGYSAPPPNVQGYLNIDIDGTPYRIPFYNQ